MPETVLNYVLRTGEIVILNEAGTKLPFAADPYIRQHGAGSILCLPLMNQAELTARFISKTVWRLTRSRRPGSPC